MRLREIEYSGKKQVFLGADNKFAPKVSLSAAKRAAIRSWQKVFSSVKTLLRKPLKSRFRGGEKKLPGNLHGESQRLRAVSEKQTVGANEAQVSKGARDNDSIKRLRMRAKEGPVP